MSDNSYNVEVRQASKNGYFTPEESRAYYKRYSRQFMIWHWWGQPGLVGNHQQIVDYILRTAASGTMSVNYVLSNLYITMLVYLLNVSWGAQSGNPDGINVELEPTLNDEGYKKAGWLKDQCEQVVGYILGNRKHSDFNPTQCPGTISLDRIEQETDKWRRKVYDQPAVVMPPPAITPPPAPQLIVIDDTDREMFTLSNAKLVNMDGLSIIKTFPLDTPMAVSQKVRYNNLEFYRTASAVKDGRLQGFLVGDLKDAKTAPAPVEPPKPEWVANLHDIDDTRFWFKHEQKLIDITTGKPALNSKGEETVFAKDADFISSAVTKVGKAEYRIADYSFKKDIFNGVPISSLTLTEPGVPDLPPVPNFEQRLNALEALVKTIVEFLTAMFGFKK